MAAEYSSSRTSSRAAGPRPRWGHAVLRLLSLLLMLQISGAGSLVSSLIGSEEAGCSERCADDEPEGAQCPPSCPSCTCVHAAWTGLPTSAPPAVRVRLASVALLAVPFSRSLHRNPNPAGIFRPPRG